MLERAKRNIVVHDRSIRAETGMDAAVLDANALREARHSVYGAQNNHRGHLLWHAIFEAFCVSEMRKLKKV